jgi:hypothetical protein
MPTTTYIPRVFGGTLILVNGGPPTPPRVLSIKLASLKQHINVSLAAQKQHVNVAFRTLKQHINVSLSEVAMTTPNTTVDSSATLTDQNGNLITSVSSATLLVTYQDGTTASPTVVNMGSGVYTATYATKAGVLTELWSFTDTTGAVAQEQRTLTIVY